MKKFARLHAALFQSRGCICLIVDGGTLASNDIIADIALASNVILGVSPLMKSMLTGLPHLSMSPAVGSRNFNSLISSPCAMIDLRNDTRSSAPLTGLASVLDSSSAMRSSHYWISSQLTPSHFTRTMPSRALIASADTHQPSRKT